MSNPIPTIAVLAVYMESVWVCKTCGHDVQRLIGDFYCCVKCNSIVHLLAEASMKVSDLSGPLLDYWVARAGGLDPAEVRVPPFGIAKIYRDGKHWTPSTSWADGGPIIEREGIGINRYKGTGHAWEAFTDINVGVAYGDSYLEFDNKAVGDTPLVAAMRCYVESKFGEEVSDDETRTLA